METSAIWSTRDVDRSQASAYWAKTLSERMPGLTCEAMDRGFEGSLRQGRAGSLTLSKVSAMPQRVTSTARHSAPFQFSIIYLRSGLLRVEQCSRSIELRPQECVLLSLNTCEVVTCIPSDSLNITMSGSWVRQWLARPEAEVVKPFRLGSPRARPLLEVLNLLSEDDGDDLGVGGELIANQVGGALALAVGAADVSGTPHSAKLVWRLKQAIGARAFDPEYRAQIAADEAGISRRYLVSLFASEGTTFRAELMRVRLQKSAQMLCDPCFLSLSTMEISHRCGFSDASHFSKRFRERYGVTPAQYRDGHQPPVMPSSRAT